MHFILFLTQININSLQGKSTDEMHFNIALYALKHLLTLYISCLCRALKVAL
jgi:hypothetical protein